MEQKRISSRKVRVGKVVSDKMDKTVSSPSRTASLTLCIRRSSAVRIS